MTPGGPLPVLADGRVVLRAARPEDGPAIDAGSHDPDVMRWIGPPRPSVEALLAENEARWAGGSPTFVVCDPDGAFAGLVWVNRREPGSATGYVGYWLVAAARGRGLATSAVRLISEWAFRELGIQQLRLTTAPANEGSQRVAERSGFRRLGLAADDATDAREVGQMVFALDGPEPAVR